MSVGSKTILAKLLATEDIIVRVDAKAKTASFDVKNRILTIPNWSIPDEDISDMMTGHEVGHSLWTGYEDWYAAIDKDKLHKGILNVVEDARIEKKIKRKYPGLVRDFISAYRTLAERGFFFDSGREDPKDMNLVDRINLHFKLGALFGIPFKHSEDQYVSMVDACESFDDVKEVTRILMDKLLEDQEEFDQASDIEYVYGDAMEGGEEYDISPGGEIEGGNDTSSGDSADDDEDQADGEEDQTESYGGYGDQEVKSPEDQELDEDCISTQRRFDQMINEALRKSQEGVDKEFIYFTLPTPIMNNMVVSYKSILRDLTPLVQKNDEYLVQQLIQSRQYDRKLRDWNSEFNSFRRQSQKIISYMAKEFERKKAAAEYRKESIAKTGVLDVNKLYSYKYNDDLFLRNTIRPDGKNHGMVMLIDWSASMTGHMLDTMKQTMNLVWFCQKVNIPFEVYAFSNSYRHGALDDLLSADRTDDNKDAIRAAMLKLGTFSYKEGDGEFSSDTHLLNFFSSRMSAKQQLEMMKMMYRVAGSCASERWSRFDLSSTPLVEGLVGMTKVIPNFKNHYNLDIVNLMILTDGDCNSAMDRIHHEDEDPGRLGYKKGLRGYYKRENTFLEDPVTKRSYCMDQFMVRGEHYVYEGKIQERAVLTLLKDRYDVNIVGIFLDSYTSGRRLSRGTLDRFIGQRYFNQEAHAAARKECRKDGLATVQYKAYDEFYIVPTGTLRDNAPDNLNIDENMTVGKMAGMFKKQQTSKFGNKVLVNRMTDIISV